MDSSQLLGITTLTYLFATILYAIIFVFKLPKLAKATTFFTAIAFLTQTIGIGLRWIESYQMGIGHAPLTNMYESVVFFSWTIILLYLLMEWKYKTRVMGVFTVPLAFLAMAYASFGGVGKTITPLVPALQSNWLISHVITCFIGYAGFALAAGLGTMYLIKQGRAGRKENILAKRLPSLETIDDLTHKMMVFGFIWLTCGIISGAIWANSAWGTYWSWDPKETWSLITWFIYALALHVRYTRDWSGSRIATLAIFGFLCVLFTYYGVNFLLSGLHSYGSA
ncbi:c-type cytochrome biogenesis protein CcsB [Desulfotalea psychrophila]|uniref:Probable cytochrome c biogenesis protein (CcsA) n=1 Tax=Desulfotalea psychrophila (strain LSv54 / DSM 12343) TaxID=177439 RepID=Q6AML5_DESPS|nr:c-type cytochrome biogenesis protein CcsB [Desulfotalea psychrophila]CAG36410.1 probable cytochrome c biogenesis protein (CcsA) [Desulfotalea psychrophila LSv54]